MGEKMIRVAPTPDALARMAAELVVQSAQDAIALRDEFSLVLSGGSTPKALYHLLADAPYEKQVDWSKVHILFGDERCVPPDHPDSNYLMASQAMLKRLPIPARQIHRMRGEIAPEAAAAEYDALLRALTRDHPLDLVLLGLGDDAHTASLFPHTSALNVTDRLCVSNWVEKLKTHRITMTAPLLNQAHEIVFLVAGANKAQAVHDVLEGPPDPDRLPSQMIQPVNGKLIWLLDAAAAEMEQST